ncbi:Magnesium transporter [gamma proteobacterium HdN1]|nr:Magnesium transporter [gamma proteobacterium HdN1]
MSELDEELVNTVTELIQNNRITSATDRLKSLHPSDIADIITQLPASQSWRVLERLPERAEVFAYFEPEQQIRLATELPRLSLARLMNEMSADERTDLFKRFSRGVRESLLQALALDEQEDIRILASHMEGTAGAIMTTELVILRKAMTVARAMAMLRKEAPEAETIYHAYVVDLNRKLIGVVSLRELLIADPEARIADLMISEVVSAKVTDKQEEIARTIARYDLLALPITDDEGTLLGIVTYDDAMDVVNEEVEDDFHKSAGMGTVTGSFKEASIYLLYRKRVFWLVFLVFGNLFSSAGIAHFEDIIASNLVLVFFLPLLVGSGGNAGSQSSTLMVRAIATGDVEVKDWLQLIGRETLVALALGGTMGAAVASLGYWRGGSEIAIVVCLSMVSIVLVGCLVGLSLPFVLDRLGFDPAGASAPLVTSICDATGVVLYLFIASQLLVGVGAGT